MKKLNETNLFRALRSRNFVLYFIGRAVSQFGTWMQRTAVIWVVYTITHSAFWIGVTIFAEQFPSFLFSFWGGVAADRYDRFRVIQVTQATSIVQAVLLAVLVLTGHTAVWAILVLSVILGVINAFDVPARQSLFNEIIADPADLSNALSLSTATASLAQLLGPALSGIILASFGAATCFFINALSFVAVMVSLWLMDRPFYQPKSSHKKVTRDFAEGFAYIWKTPSIGLVILMLSIVSLLVLPYNTVLPVFAKVIFKGDAKTFGYVTSVISAGAVAGTIFLASRKPGTHMRRILFVSTIVMGIGMIFFSQFKYFPLAMFFAAVTGFGSIAQFTVCNIVVQSESAPQMRGRAIGILLMAIFGMMPLGSVIVGAVSERIGAPATVLAEGILAICIALAFVKFLTKNTAGSAVTDASLEEPGDPKTY
ncbi:MAG: MFS transporter [Bacteroidetes bacterium]|nr:MFS transporter [Bacteroidota bacterium]